MSVRDEVVKIVRSTGIRLGPEFDDDTSLLRSGLVDSKALFSLMLLVEERIDPGVDLTAFDLRQELDTVSSILAFIDKHRPGGKGQSLR